MAKTNRTRLAWWLTTAAVAVFVFACIYLPVSRQRIQADLTEARNNLRSMSFALYEFETAYGAFPNADTAKQVIENTDSELLLGAGSANAVFRQLIAAEICQSESLFYAKIPGTRKPDNDFSRPENALAKGEVGYSYILGHSSRSPAETPLVVTPLVPGTNRFDPKPFKGRAVIMRIDSLSAGGIDVLPINPHGEVIDSSGKHLLAPDHPIWHGKAPVIVWPE
jgi:hypothetical protein